MPSWGWADKPGEAFLTSLAAHAVPKLGKHRVDMITGDQVIAALSPIWTDKPQQARKVRQRIMLMLGFAKARGWRTSLQAWAGEAACRLAFRGDAARGRARVHRRPTG